MAKIEPEDEYQWLLTADAIRRVLESEPKLALLDVPTCIYRLRMRFEKSYCHWFFNESYGYHLACAALEDMQSNAFDFASEELNDVFSPYMARFGSMQSEDYKEIANRVVAILDKYQLL